MSGIRPARILVVHDVTENVRMLEVVLRRDSRRF